MGLKYIQTIACIILALALLTGRAGPFMALAAEEPSSPPASEPEPTAEPAAPETEPTAEPAAPETEPTAEPAAPESTTEPAGPGKLAVFMENWYGNTGTARLVIQSIPAQADAIWGEASSDGGITWVRWDAFSVSIGETGLADCTFLAPDGVSRLYRVWASAPDGRTWVTAGYTLPRPEGDGSNGNRGGVVEPEQPERTAVPTATPAPTATPMPTATPAPTTTPVPTSTPVPTATATPVPTSTPVPLPTAAPIPTAAVRLAEEAAPTAAPEPTTPAVPAVTTAPTAADVPTTSTAPAPTASPASEDAPAAVRLFGPGKPAFAPPVPVTGAAVSSVPMASSGPTSAASVSSAPAATVSPAASPAATARPTAVPEVTTAPATEMPGPDPTAVPAQEPDDRTLPPAAQIGAAAAGVGICTVAGVAASGGLSFRKKR